MPQIDPSLLLFAGNLLSNAGGGRGFGNSLGGALTGAGQALAYRQQQDSQRRKDLIDAAESAIGIRAALLELQQNQRQQEAFNTYVGGLPEDQQAAARAAGPQFAAQQELQANQGLTPYQEQSLGLQREQLALATEQQEFDQSLDLAKLEAQQQAPRAKLSDTSSLRAQYIRESKDFSTIASSYKKILNSTPTAAGDLNLIFSYMKMLDPTSVVRESEQGLVIQATGIPDQIKNLAYRVKDGVKLTDAQRKNFKTEAGILFDSVYTGQANRRDQFSGIAERSGMDPADIIDAVSVSSPQKIREEWIDRRIKRAGISLGDLDYAAQLRGISIEEALELYEQAGAIQ